MNLGVYSAESVIGVEQENNDTIENANSIMTNELYSGTIEGYSSYYNKSSDDFYKIELPVDGNVTLSIENQVGIYWAMELMDGSGRSFNSVGSRTGVDVRDKNIKTTEVSTGLPKGTYYVKINGDGASVNVPYQFEVKYVKNPYFEKEFNDTIESANLLELNKKYTGVIEWYSSYYNNSAKDYYRISLPADGLITLSIDNEVGVRRTIQLLDGSGNIFNTVTSKSGVEVRDKNIKTSEVLVGLPKGIYYVSVDGDGASADVPYQFLIKYKGSSLFEKEFNDTKESATNILLDKTYTGVIEWYSNYYSNSAADYYKVMINQPTVVKYNLSNRIGIRTYFHIENSKGDILYSGETKDNKTGYSTFTYNLKSGTYYLRISSNSEDSLYSFNFAQVSAPLKTTQVKVKNNKGKADTITVNGIAKGDTIKVIIQKGYYWFLASPLEPH